jgi:hypothetical protein
MTNRDAFHENYGARDELRRSSDRAFGLIFAAVFALVSLWPVISGGTVRWWAAATAMLFLVTAIARPTLLTQLNRVWALLGMVLHRIANPILMGFIFFLVVTPIGLTMRLLGKRPLDLEFDPGAKSYWKKRQPPGPPPETMKNQF